MAHRMSRPTWLLTATALLLLISGCAATGEPGMARPVSVAVWDLEDLSISPHVPAGMGELLASRIVDRLGRTGDYRVVERQHLIKVMEELNIGSSDLADPQTRLRLGRIIGAQQMVFGAFQAAGPVMRLDLRRVDVASGRVVKTATAQAAGDDVEGWLRMAEQAAAQLLGQ